MYIFRVNYTGSCHHDLGNLRTKQKYYHERVPQERLDEYDSTRTMNADRKQKLINNRFPELSAAREAFLGKDPTQVQKRNMALEIVQFDNAVEKLAMDEEPFAARA